MDPSVPQKSNRKSSRTVLLFALHVPSLCLFLLVFGFVKSTWTAALIIMGAVSMLIGLAIWWGLKQSRVPDE
jgi:hypothetical protein